MNWNDFTHNKISYSFSHLNPRVVSVTRAATNNFPAKTVRFFVSYSNHCFTKHFADNDDESLLYEDSERYFCRERYEGSLLLPGLIPTLIERNILLALTMFEHRESFFYLEEFHMGVEYRLFFDISISNHPASDIRLKIKSAYPQEPWADAVGSAGHFNFWRVVDARLAGEKLALKAQQRRRRR